MEKETNLIELLKKNTAQLADWQFKEILVEKINEVIIKVNQLTEFAEIENLEEKIDLDKEFPENDQEKLDKEKAEAEEAEAKARAEEERAAKELENQNAPGNQQ